MTENISGLYVHLWKGKKNEKSKSKLNFNPFHPRIYSLGMVPYVGEESVSPLLNGMTILILHIPRFILGLKQNSYSKCIHSQRLAVLSLVCQTLHVSKKQMRHLETNSHRFVPGGFRPLWLLHDCLMPSKHWILKPDTVSTL